MKEEAEGQSRRRLELLFALRSLLFALQRADEAIVDFQRDAFADEIDRNEQAASSSTADDDSDRVDQRAVAHAHRLTRLQAGLDRQWLTAGDRQVDLPQFADEPLDIDDRDHPRDAVRPQALHAFV